jgi:hypothetical protein
MRIYSATAGVTWPCRRHSSIAFSAAVAGSIRQSLSTDGQWGRGAYAMRAAEARSKLNSLADRVALFNPVSKRRSLISADFLSYICS